MQWIDTVIDLREEGGETTDDLREGGGEAADGFYNLGNCNKPKQEKDLGNVDRQ